MNRTRKFQIGDLTVHLIEGDIATVKADALITAINSSGMWFGGIDGVINRAAGNMFHVQAGVALPLKHAQTIIAKKQASHRGQFGDVVFVIDDLQGPLREVVGAALKAADGAGYRIASLPAIRTGVMLGMVEKDAGEAARETVAALTAFAAGQPSLKELTMVVYNQPDIFGAFAYDLERARL